MRTPNDLCNFVRELWRSTQMVTLIDGPRAGEQVSGKISYLLCEGGEYVRVQGGDFLRLYWMAFPMIVEAGKKAALFDGKAAAEKWLTSLRANASELVQAKIANWLRTWGLDCLYDHRLIVETWVEDGERF